MYAGGGLHIIDRENIANDLYDKYKYDESIPIECVINMCLLFNYDRKIIQFDKYMYNDVVLRNLKTFLTDDIFSSYIKCINTPQSYVIFLDEREYLDSILADDEKIRFYEDTVRLNQLNKHEIVRLRTEIEAESTVTSNIPDLQHKLHVTTQQYQEKRKFINKIPTCNGVYIDPDKLQTCIDASMDYDFYKHCKYPAMSYINVVRVAFIVIGPVSRSTEHGVSGRIMRQSNYIGQLLTMECSRYEIEHSIVDIYKLFNKYVDKVSLIDSDLQFSLEFYTKIGNWESQPMLAPCTSTYLK